MSTTDGAIDQKLFYDLEWILLSSPENSYSNELSAIKNNIYHFQHKSNKIINIPA